jgi:hypothetical protein
METGTLIEGKQQPQPAAQDAAKSRDGKPNAAPERKNPLS